MNNIKFFLIAVLFLSLAGCGNLKELKNPPTPKYIIKHPIGTDAIKIGMSKDKVEELWGRPDQINFVEDEKRWGGPRVEWVYFAKTSLLPIDAGYLTKTRMLYFDGDSLTNIAEK